jgi:hypothetical protein
MNAQKLLKSLKAQEQNLDQLLDVLEEQKKAIVQNNYVALEKSITAEQKILQIVEKEEHIRLKEVEEIARYYSLELKENKLDDLIENGKGCLGSELKELKKVRISLKNKLKNILNANSILKEIVDFSRNMIKETMVLISGSNNQAFVNKKV